MITRTVRAKVFARDAYCLHCGLTEGLTIQHRINRGAGGSKLRDHPANLIALCGLSNGLLESDAAFAQTGIIHGWKLRSWEDPFTTPVLDAVTGRYWTLDDQFNRTITENRAA